MGIVFARVTHPCQPSPIPLSGRPAHRPFRGLLSVYLRCGLHTRTVTVCRDRYPKASDTSSPPCLLRSLPAGAVAGWGLHPLEKHRLVTAPEVKFLTWTDDNLLRQVVYQGLRDDKPAVEVRRPVPHPN